MRKLLLGFGILLALVVSANAYTNWAQIIKDVNPYYLRIETQAATDYRGIGLRVVHKTQTGTTYGAWFKNQSSAGIGAMAECNSETGQTYGFNGTIDSPTGAGVRGECANIGPYTGYGVEGKTACLYGYGVYGHVSATDGCAYGVYGVVSVDSSFGVYGVNSSTTGNAVGVQGETINGSGVVGICSGTAGVGVYGIAAPTLGTSVGVLAQTNGLGAALQAAGPIIGSEQFYQALCPTNVYPPTTGGVYMIDETNGIYVANVDGTAFYVAFEVPQAVLYRGDMTIDSLVVTYSTDSGDDSLAMSLWVDSDDCATSEAVSADVYGSGEDGCATHVYALDANMDDVVFFLKIDPYDTPDAGDIKIERLEMYGTYDAVVATLP